MPWRPITYLCASAALASIMACCQAPPAQSEDQGLGKPGAGILVPPGTESVAVPLANGQVLRGLFVPAGSDAPVVLHLLEPKMMITYGLGPHTRGKKAFGYPCVWELRGIGLASLVLDWRGHGKSDGEVLPENIPEDAEAMYAEAVRRAGGAAEKVIVRALSIGTLGLGALLERGIRPSGCILFAPVRARTVTTNWVRHRLWSPLAAVADLFAPDFSGILETSLERCLVQVRAPLLVFAPEPDRDGLVTSADAQRLRQAVDRANGRWVPLHDRHFFCAAAGHYVRPEERRFVNDMFPSRTYVADRLTRQIRAMEPSLRHYCAPATKGREILGTVLSCVDLRIPELAAAAATSTLPVEELVRWVSWIQWNHEHGTGSLSYDRWRDLLATDDPAGRVSLQWILRIVPWCRGRRPSAGSDVFAARFVQEVMGRVQAYLEEDKPDYGDFFLYVNALCCLSELAGDEGGAAWPDRQRLFQRTLLKAFALPDRVEADREGRVRHEVWSGDHWVRVEPLCIPEAAREALARYRSGLRDVLEKHRVGKFFEAAEPPPMNASFSH